MAFVREESRGARPEEGGRGVDHKEAVALAMRTGLTACDASYLWLARATGVPLLTLDTMVLKSLGQEPVDPERSTL
jgi:hypothetical protein